MNTIILLLLSLASCNCQQEENHEPRTASEIRGYVLLEIGNIRTYMPRLCAGNENYVEITRGMRELLNTTLDLINFYPNNGHLRQALAEAEYILDELTISAEILDENFTTTECAGFEALLHEFCSALHSAVMSTDTEDTALNIDSFISANPLIALKETIAGKGFNLRFRQG